MQRNRKEKPKTWSRKGVCPSCGVGTGSKHNESCTFDYKYLTCIWCGRNKPQGVYAKYCSQKCMYEASARK